MTTCRCVYCKSVMKEMQSGKGLRCPNDTCILYGAIVDWRIAYIAKERSKRAFWLAVICGVALLAAGFVGGISFTIATSYEVVSIF